MSMLPMHWPTRRRTYEKDVNWQPVRSERSTERWEYVSSDPQSTRPLLDGLATSFSVSRDTASDPRFVVSVADDHGTALSRGTRCILWEKKVYSATLQSLRALNVTKRRVVQHKLDSM